MREGRKEGRKEGERNLLLIGGVRGTYFSGRKRKCWGFGEGRKFWSGARVEFMMGWEGRREEEEMSCESRILVSGGGGWGRVFMDGKTVSIYMWEDTRKRLE